MVEVQSKGLVKLKYKGNGMMLSSQFILDLLFEA